MYKLLIEYTCQNRGQFQSVSQPYLPLAGEYSGEQDKTPASGELTGSIDCGENRYKHIHKEDNFRK